MGSFANSWALTKASLNVVRQDKELLWMPILSFLASAAAVLAIAGVAFAAWPQVTTPTLDPQTGEEGFALNGAGLALAFLLYVLLAFVAVFFHAAVVAAANERLSGGDPTVGSALRAAGRRAGALFVWAIVVATVNVILQAARERSGALGRILASIAGGAWNLATTFVVPVILFEPQGLGATVRSSFGLFKRNWGEAAVGQGGIGLVGGIAMVLTVLAGLAVTFALASALGVYGLFIGLAILVTAAVLVGCLFSVLGGVYKAALYRYATTGQAGAAFGATQLQGAFAPR